MSMDAFCFLYSKLLLAELCLFVFGATFAAWPWHFVSICNFVICDKSLPVVQRSWPRRQGVRLNSRGRRVLVFSLVFVKRSFTSVKKIINQVINHLLGFFFREICSC